MTYKNVRVFEDQLSDTRTNCCMLYFNFLRIDYWIVIKLCLIGLMDPLDIFAECNPSKSFSVIMLLQYGYLHCIMLEN